MAFNFQRTKSFEQEPELEQNTLDAWAEARAWNFGCGSTALF